MSNRGAVFRRLRRVATGSALVLACALLFAPRTLGAEKETPSKRVAERVVQAHAAGDNGLLARVSSGSWPDPWLVAFRLCATGRKEAAAALAKASDHPGLEGLCDHGDLWAKTKVADDLFERWDAVEAAFARRDWEATVAASREVEVGRHRLLRAALGYFVGSSLIRLERHAEALPVLAEAGQAASDIGWWRGIASTYWVLGDAQRRQYDYEGAYESWARAAGAYGRVRNRRFEALARANLGSLSISLGDYRSAVRQLRPTVRILHDLSKEHRAQGQVSVADDMVRSVGTYLRNAAMAQGRLGEHATAILNYQLARKLAVEVGDREGVAECDLGLASTHASVGDYAEARRLARLAIEAFRALGQPDGVARATGTLGLVCAQDEEYELALQHYRRAHEDLVGLDRKLEATWALEGEAVVLGLQGRLRDAKEKLRSAVAVYEELHDVQHEVDALYWLAEFERREGNLAAAAKGFARLRERADVLDAGEVLVDAHLGLAEVELARKRFAAAMRAARRAVVVMTRTVGGLGLEQGALARAPRQRVFEVGMEAAAQVGSAADFSYFLESGRAGALLETLEAREEIRDKVIPEQLREREEDALRSVAAARTRLQEAVAANDLRASRRHRRDLESAQKAVRAAVEEIQRIAKVGADWLYTEPAPLTEIREELKATDALVEYAFVGEKAYALVATREDVRTIALGAKSVVEAAASKAAAALEDQGADPTKALAALSKLVVAPLALRRHVKRLLVLPDGSLYLVPLSTLAPDYETMYVPSGTTIVRLRLRAVEPGRGVLGLGDPAYPELGDPGGRGGERVPRGPTLHRLPATRAEVSAISTRRLLGEGATEASLRDALGARRRWRSVHLACHGLIDPAHPMRSMLALTPEEPDDGYLTAMEVLGMRIDTDLAVLSACDSGRGRVYSGEGLVGFTRAFMLAGAPRLIVSLWRVEDEATKALMVKFYELWSPKAGAAGDPAGMRASEALKRAQEHVRKQQGWEDPYFWAAWVLWGLPD